MTTYVPHHISLHGWSFLYYTDIHNGMHRELRISSVIGECDMYPVDHSEAEPTSSALLSRKSLSLRHHIFATLL